MTRVVPLGRYRFGIFEFDATSLDLRKAGRAVRLRPQALKLLRLLVAHPRELITRDVINRELWEADVFVDFEQGINHSVKQLRAALGDDAEAPRYIETVPRRGYRFIAPVERMPDVEEAPVSREVESASPPAVVGLSPPPVAPAPGPSRPLGRTWLIAAAAAALVVAAGVAWQSIGRQTDSPVVSRATVSLAVLPLDVASLPIESRYLGSSLAEAVSSRLSTVAGMRVRPIESTRGYENRSSDVAAIARELRVDFVLAGRLVGQGRTNRAELSLVNAGTERPLWRGAVESDDLIHLETAIADQVISALSASPPAHARGRTENRAAYEAYLQGRFYLSRYTSEDTLRAVAAFEAALAIDPKYPLAHAGLAKAGAQMFIRFASEGEAETWRNRAEQQARRALELDGTLAEAHEALAAVARHIDFDWDRTIEQSVEALRLNPSLDLPHYYLASALQHTGRLEMVEPQVVAGLEANPLNLAEAYRLRGTNALWAGQFAEARTHFERLRELAGKPVSYTPLAQALYYLGESLQAEAMLSGLRGSAQSEQRASAMLASFLAARGERRDALTLIDQVLFRTYRDHHVAYSLGATYAGLGRPAEAFQWLREAAATGFLCQPWYATDPLLEPLRKLPEFPKLLSDVKAAGDRIAVESLRDLERVP